MTVAGDGDGDGTGNGDGNRTETKPTDAANATDTDDTADNTDADWIDPVDETVLEYMGREEYFSPDQIAAEDVCRGPHAAYRCRELTKRGLLTKHMPGVYDITDLGEQVLAGEVELAELGDDDEGVEGTTEDGADGADREDESDTSGADSAE
ncbi:hypothetical protein C482_10077 [Natrialba chahannaoensis JCM 10990]|uniref:PhiH1 repressor-like protein n=1 Tax=Natrialba chahannaoensis JCM 10990 TaxID=1227492 RepID=M0AM71_9EURY|nr:hypothetical protein [Natrialba chahannaoensis]ELY99825.1 hypothetical protein C482_10077 [Natrialba chahannaoensis JCM 10990]